MGRRQLELIEAGNLTGLLDVLSAKQRPLLELQRAERAIDPFRSQDPQRRRWQSPEVRAACAAADRGVRPVAAGDYRPGKTERRDLSRRRDQAAAQLHGMHAAGQARGAYSRRGVRHSTNSISFPTVRSPNDDPSHLSPDPLMLDEKADLQTVLAAWHSATLRLEQTHEALRRGSAGLTGELEAKNRELARKNRLADLGQMASHVAHEVRNNLVPVTLYLSLLRRRIAGDAGSLDMLDKIAAGFTALDVMVNDLLHFTSDRDPQLQTFSLRR